MFSKKKDIVFLDMANHAFFITFLSSQHIFNNCQSTEIVIYSLNFCNIRML